jgi:hypothetical protein
MGIYNNQRFINLKSETIEGFFDLKVKADKRDGRDVICVELKNSYAWFSIEEIEALHSFAQIVKNQ